MIETDTVRLLRECDAGVKMGIQSIDDVLGFVHAAPMRSMLEHCREQHTLLHRDIEAALDRFGDDGKNPNPMATAMSWLKTNIKLVMHESDSTIAGLMVDGCDMGVKSLSRYLNEYEAADEASKTIAKRLIAMEEQLGKGLRAYL